MHDLSSPGATTRTDARLRTQRRPPAGPEITPDRVASVGERPLSTRYGDPERLDAQTVIYRLEEAGRTLLGLPQTGFSTRLRLNTIEFVRSALEGYGWEQLNDDRRPIRSGVPSAARITRMDEALAWIPLIPQDRYVLRRVVGCRSLVSPVTDRHLFPWRRIGALLGADHKAVQRWHAQGIDMIVTALNARRSG